MSENKNPQRFQLRRTKGWRIPPNTVICDRRSEWGNPFVVGKDGDAATCVRKYIKEMVPYTHRGPQNDMGSFLLSVANLERIQSALRGKNVGCWCPPGSPCHADWLLKIANEPAYGS